MKASSGEDENVPSSIGRNERAGKGPDRTWQRASAHRILHSLLGTRRCTGFARYPRPKLASPSMSARVVYKMAIKEDPQNYLLMQCVGVNVSGQVASVIAGGLLLNLLV